MERRIVTAGFAQDALDCLKAYEIDPKDVLAAAGLPEQLNDGLTSEEFGALWWTIARFIEDEFFGLAKRSMYPGGFALLCHASLQTRSLEQALRRAMLYLRVVIEEPYGEMQIKGGEVRITLADPEGPRSAFAYRTYWLILMGVASWLVGRQLPLRRLEFACEAPERFAEYSHFFGAPAIYECDQTALVFNSEYLRWPVVRSEKSLRSFLKGAPGNLVVRYKQEEGLGLRIRERLNAIPPVDWPGIEEFAEEFNVSSATLRRRLATEGRSIGGIKDELRQIRARKLLADDRLTVADVAAELGYSEPSAFHRAHRKWTGRSPRSG